MHLPPCLFSRKTAALKTTHSNVSCSCRGLSEARREGRSEGVEKHRTCSCATKPTGLPGGISRVPDRLRWVAYVAAHPVVTE